MSGFWEYHKIKKETSYAKTTIKTGAVHRSRTKL